MQYQLVLQFSGDSLEGYDAMLALEDDLIQEFGDAGVDGHDGVGTERRWSPEDFEVSGKGLGVKGFKILCGGWRKGQAVGELGAIGDPAVRRLAGLSHNVQAGERDAKPELPAK